MGDHDSLNSYAPVVLGESISRSCVCTTSWREWEVQALHTYIISVAEAKQDGCNWIPDAVLFSYSQQGLEPDSIPTDL